MSLSSTSPGLLPRVAPTRRYLKRAPSSQATAVATADSWAAEDGHVEPVILMLLADTDLWETARVELLRRGVTSAYRVTHPAEASELAKERQVRGQRIDCAILDLQLLGPTLGGAVQWLRSELPPYTVVATLSSAHASVGDALLIARSCALHVPQPTSVDDLVMIALDVRQRSMGGVLEAFRELTGLSPQEARLLNMAALGKNSDEAADLLGISRSTIGSYWNRIFRKTGCRSQRDVLGAVLKFASSR